MTREADKEKFDRAKAWFNKLSDEQKGQVFNNLLHHLIMTEDVIIPHPADVDEAVEETGEPREKFEAPFWESCGDSILDI